MDFQVHRRIFGAHVPLVLERHQVANMEIRSEHVLKISDCAKNGVLPYTDYQLLADTFRAFVTQHSQSV